MDIQRHSGLRATMSDGVELVADVWHPSQGGPWPVLLQRLPYGRSVASGPVLPHPSWFARRGYAVVVQDCRGRGESGGRFEPFVNEGADGFLSIEWAARLPFCDGRVATYGFSYQGLSQLYAAAQRPPSLRAIAPMMCCPDPFEGWTYEGGMLRWPFVCFWAAQLAGQDTRRPPNAFDTGVVPIAGALGTAPPAWFTEWLDHPTDDSYWAARRPDIEAINVPAFTTLGWFDDFSSGTAALIERLGAQAWCGPWAHMPWGTVHGGVEFGHDASPNGAWDALVDFFDAVFARTDGTRREERVRFYVIGEGWRTSPNWPPLTSPAHWFGVSETGNALSRWGDGRLVAAARYLEHSTPSVLVAEPHAPAPGNPVDYQDESALHDRRDIVCFTTEPFDAPIVIAGSPSVRLTSTCDRTRHDVVVTLCVVGPDESARVVTSYAERMIHPMTPGSIIEWDITLRPIAVRLPTGSRLRLTVAGARFPCYDRNAHTTAQAVSTPADEQLVATIEIDDVRLTLPILVDTDAVSQ